MARIEPLIAPFDVEVPSPSAGDGYFAGEPGMVAVFDFDYDVIAGFEKQLKWAQFGFLPCFWPSSLCCYPCFLNQNVEWNTRAQHVALTVDGIRYVKERRPAFCGMSWSDVGKESKTVPYDKITDCDVQEPAGAACCCCVPRVLSVVQVDTASSGTTKEGRPVHELELKGLKNASEFKQAVWGMKRGQAPPGTVLPLGARLGAAIPQQMEMMSSPLLVELRDELRELNAHLRQRAKVEPPSAA